MLDASKHTSEDRISDFTQDSFCSLGSDKTYLLVFEWKANHLGIPLKVPTHVDREKEEDGGPRLVSINKLILVVFLHNDLETHIITLLNMAHYAAQTELSRRAEIHLYWLA